MHLVKDAWRRVMSIYMDSLGIYLSIFTWRLRISLVLLEIDAKTNGDTAPGLLYV